MLRPDTFALTLLLSLLTALGPLSMDMYLPSLPDIGRALDAPTAQVQLTIASYLFGFAVGQIVYGPVSDRLGRKPVLLAALALYGVASVGCALTASIGALTAMRFVQALGGAGSIVLARAVVRDLYSGARAGRELSLMGSVTAFAPIVAPVIGGVLQTLFGWRSSFVLLVIFAAVSATAAARLLPETLRQRTAGPFSLAAISGLYRSVLRHRGFLANLGILTTTFVGLFAWVSGAPVVMQGSSYGLSPLLFGVTFAMAAAGYLRGNVHRGAHRHAHRHRPHHGDRLRDARGRRIDHGGGRGARACECHLVRRRDDRLSGRPRLRFAGVDGRRADAVSRPRRHRVLADGIYPAIGRRHHRRGGRLLSRPIGLAGCRRRRRDGLPRAIDLALDAPRARRAMNELAGRERCPIWPLPSASD